MAWELTQQCQEWTPIFSGGHSGHCDGDPGGARMDWDRPHSDLNPWTIFLALKKVLPLSIDINQYSILSALVNSKNQPYTHIYSHSWFQKEWVLLLMAKLRSISIQTKTTLKNKTQGQREHSGRGDLPCNAAHSGLIPGMPCDPQIPPGVISQEKPLSTLSVAPKPKWIK